MNREVSSSGGMESCQIKRIKDMYKVRTLITAHMPPGEFSYAFYNCNSVARSVDVDAVAETVMRRRPVLSEPEETVRAKEELALLSLAGLVARAKTVWEGKEP